MYLTEEHHKKKKGKKHKIRALDQSPYQATSRPARASESASRSSVPSDGGATGTRNASGTRPTRWIWREAQQRWWGTCVGEGYGGPGLSVHRNSHLGDGTRDESPVAMALEFLQSGRQKMALMS